MTWRGGQRNCQNPEKTRSCCGGLGLVDQDVVGRGENKHLFLIRSSWSKLCLSSLLSVNTDLPTRCGCFTNIYHGPEPSQAKSIPLFLSSVSELLYFPHSSNEEADNQSQITCPPFRRGGAIKTAQQEFQRLWIRLEGGGLTRPWQESGREMLLA